MATLSYVSLALYFMAMLGIGLFAYRTASSDLAGYILGGRKVSPQVTALSAGASDMSGWMLMGLPGAMYVSGFDTIWIAVGLLIGAWMNYMIVAPRLRVYTQFADDSLTLPEFFSKRFKQNNAPIRIISAAVIIVFFTLYTSAGLVGGGKLFESAFGLSYELGLLVTMLVVVSYTLLGGFLAVSMTDFVQGCIMFLALALVPVVAYFQFTDTAEMLSYTTENIPSLTESMQGLGVVSIISSLAWGLGYFGQPHIVVRFMAIRSVKDIKVARRIGISWMLVTIIGALACGLVGLAYANKYSITVDDPETIFIILSQVLFNPLISGFLLAAILAAIMSTISSQLLVSSSSLTEDMYRSFSGKELDQKWLVTLGRIGVLVVAVVACVLALDRSSSILSLVSNAWAGFGAAFGPLIIFSLFWSRLTHTGAVAGIVSGAVTVIAWILWPELDNGQTLSNIMYEIVPGAIVSTLSIWLVSLASGPVDDEVIESFSAAQAELQLQLNKG
ncbi:sodium/proline symporter PutP [Alteromonadaceae bacterium BrNp21-10]|nr:sodium/proline symporter PutP [Alteromonadaceae bacterium BrNp21-10]